MPTWEQICDDPNLRDLPYKIEQDRWGRIVMSPAKSDHGEYQAAIAAALSRLLPGWSILVECAIDTAEGTKVPDVGATTRARRLPNRGAAILPEAPEVCVEVMSDCNSLGELDEKRRLYADKGCIEFWVCGEDGAMTFKRPGSAAALARSEICPDFPTKIEL